MTSMITGSHNFRLGNQREGRGFIWRLLSSRQSVEVLPVVEVGRNKVAVF